MSQEVMRCPVHETGAPTASTAVPPQPRQSAPRSVPARGAAAPAEPPVADWVTQARLLADPYAVYARLRAEAPVAWVPSLKRYLVTSFTGCHTVENDQETFTADVAGAGATMKRALGGKPMLRKDDPEHATERKAINPTLRPKNLREHWAGAFRRNAEHYLGRLLERGPDAADLNTDFAAPVAAKNLVDLLGLRGASAEDMQRWSHAFIAGIGNVTDDPAIWQRADDAQAEVDALLDELVPYYREHPDGSITSALVHSGLPHETVANNVKLTISGGANEPQHMVTNIVWALSAHPDQREQVLADDTSWPRVFEEAVRWLSPIGMYPRQTTRPVELEGYHLPEGATLGVVVASANRDEAHFPEDPARFDVNRTRVPHLGFGGGPHMCAGNWAARIAIGEIAVPLLYSALPGLRTDRRRQEEWFGWVFRGLTALPVTWDG